jgi:hypothetical protein
MTDRSVPMKFAIRSRHGIEHFGWRLRINNVQSVNMKSATRIEIKRGQVTN